MKILMLLLLCSGSEKVRQVLSEYTYKEAKEIYLASLMVECPNYAEQQKIGGFFSELDDLITIHQRKCDETKELKKYISNM